MKMRLNEKNKKNIFSAVVIFSGFLFMTLFAAGCSDGINSSMADSSEEFLKNMGVTKEYYANKNHIHDFDAEGYYIEDKYWNYGELDSNNSDTGELWSFQAVAGQTYAFFITGTTVTDNDGYEMTSSATQTYLGYSKDECTQLLFLDEEEHINGPSYSSTEDGDYLLTDFFYKPYIYTATETRTVYLRVFGSVAYTSYNYTSNETKVHHSGGDYRICVRKGRMGDEYVTLSRLSPTAWVSGNLLFAQARHNSSWNDEYYYSFEATASKEYILYINDKNGDGASGTASVDANILYYNSEEKLELVYGNNYEYVNNDGYVEGFPFTAPVSGTYYLVITSQNYESQNIGTYGIAVNEIGAFGNVGVALDLWYETPKYQYKIKHPGYIAVGYMFEPFNEFELVRYDGTVIPSKQISNWGWPSEFLTLRFDTFLCCETEGDAYLWAEYEGEYYGCEFSITTTRTPSFTITLPNNATELSADTEISVTVSRNNSSKDITVYLVTSADEYISSWANNSWKVKTSTLGEAYIIANYKDEDYVYKKITITN